MHFLHALADEDQAALISPPAGIDVVDQTVGQIILDGAALGFVFLQGQFGLLALGDVQLDAVPDDVAVGQAARGGRKQPPADFAGENAHARDHLEGTHGRQGAGFLRGHRRSVFGDDLPVDDRWIPHGLFDRHSMQPFDALAEVGVAPFFAVTPESIW